MSPTFKKKAKKLGDTFNDMWRKIPLETKNLMCGGISFNSHLNDQGYALKLGLQYLKKFGSVVQYENNNPLLNDLLFSKTVLPELPL